MLPVGNPAIGDDFIDREKEIAQILDALKKDSVLLIAPRRFGKTSIMRRLKEEKYLRGGEINEELIEKVYNHRILGSEGKYYFEHYSQRLCVFYKGMGGMEEKAARAILRKVCSVEYYPVDLAFGIFKNETGIDDHEKFIDLIADLSNDFYIEHDPENGLKFYSKMLRDWWRVYYGDSE